MLRYITTLSMLISVAQAQGIDLPTIQKIPIENSQISAYVFTLDATTIDLKIVPSFKILGDKEGDLNGAPSIKDLYSMRSLGQGLNNDTLIINGGFSGAEPRRATGLLKSDDTLLSIPNFTRNSMTGLCGPGIERSQLKLSALLCRNSNGQIRLGVFDEHNWQSCTDAIQAGPVIVGPQGSVAVCQKTPASPKYIRTAICTGKNENGTHYVKIIITKDPTTLFDLAVWMSRKENSGGLGCDDAINLPGDTSSGALLLIKSKKENSFQRHLYGEGVYPQASLIVLSLKGGSAKRK